MKWSKKQRDEPEMPLRRRPLPTDNQVRRSQAFSYHAQRSIPQSNLGRGTEHIPSTPTSSAGRRWYDTAIVRGLAAVFVLMLGGYMVSLEDRPAVTAMAEGGAAYFLQDESVYLRSVHKTLGGSLLNKNKLTVDSAAIRSDLLKNHPELADVAAVSGPFSRNLTVKIIPQRPSLILTTTDSKAFLLDENGRAVVSVSQISDTGELSVPTLHDASGLSVNPGEQALPQSTVVFTESIVQILNDKGVGISSLTLPTSANELHVAIAKRPYYVKFNLVEDARQQAGTFLAVKNRLDKEKKTGVVEYIDVRVPERAYIK